MKKIFLFLAAACALASCESEQEDISNGGHITLEELVAKSTVTLVGNEVTCETKAPVNASWTIVGKTFTNNYAWKKLKKGDNQEIILKALCADGTLLENVYTVNVTEITNPLDKFWIYGEDPSAQPSFSPGAWDAAAMRFSDNEGKYLPFLSDEVYWGFKTLIFDITDAADCSGRIMNGWWSARYDGGNDVTWTNGLWELPLTEEIAKDCARGNGGSGKDLDLMVTSGSMTVNSVYYEE